MFIGTSSSINQKKNVVATVVGRRTEQHHLIEKVGWIFETHVLLEQINKKVKGVVHRHVTIASRAVRIAIVHQLKMVRLFPMGNFVQPSHSPTVGSNKSCAFGVVRALHGCTSRQ